MSIIKIKKLIYNKNKNKIYFMYVYIYNGKIKKIVCQLILLFSLSFSLSQKKMNNNNLGT